MPALRVSMFATLRMFAGMLCIVLTLGSFNPAMRNPSIVTTAIPATSSPSPQSAMMTPQRGINYATFDTVSSLRLKGGRDSSYLGNDAEFCEDGVARAEQHSGMAPDARQSSAKDGENIMGEVESSLLYGSEGEEESELCMSPPTWVAAPEDVVVPEDCGSVKDGIAGISTGKRLLLTSGRFDLKGKLVVPDGASKRVVTVIGNGANCTELRGQLVLTGEEEEEQSRDAVSSSAGNDGRGEAINSFSGVTMSHAAFEKLPPSLARKQGRAAEGFGLEVLGGAWRFAGSSLRARGGSVVRVAGTGELSLGACKVGGYAPRKAGGAGGGGAEAAAAEEAEEEGDADAAVQRAVRAAVGTYKEVLGRSEHGIVVEERGRCSLEECGVRHTGLRYGHAVACRSQGRVSLRGCAIERNSHGLLLEGGGAASLRGCTVRENDFALWAWPDLFAEEAAGDAAAASSLEVRDCRVHGTVWVDGQRPATLACSGNVVTGCEESERASLDARPGGGAAFRSEEAQQPPEGSEGAGEDGVGGAAASSCHSMHLLGAGPGRVAWERPGQCRGLRLSGGGGEEISPSGGGETKVIQDPSGAKVHFKLWDGPDEASADSDEDRRVEATMQEAQRLGWFNESLLRDMQGAAIPGEGAKCEGEISGGGGQTWQGQRAGEGAQNLSRLRGGEGRRGWDEADGVLRPAGDEISRPVMAAHSVVEDEPGTIFAPLQNRYFALRHGKSEANEAGIIVSDPENGVREYGLAQEGWEQVRGAAKALEDAVGGKEGLSHVVVYASDFLRTRETAEELLRSMGQSESDVCLVRALRERKFGELELGDHARYNDVWNEDCKSKDHTAFGVESIWSVRCRGAELVQRLEREWEGKTIVLVSHGDALQILQTAFKGVDVRTHRSLPHLSPAELRELHAEQHRP